MVRKTVLFVLMTMVTPLNTPLLTHFHLNLHSLSVITIKTHNYKNQTRTLLQQNPLLNETDLDSDNDPVFKRIPNTPK